MKRLIALILTLAMIFAFTACGGNNTATDNPPAPADETYTLTFNYPYSEAIGPGIVALMTAKSIEERSNGRLKIDCYFNSTLLTLWDTLSGVINGTADIVFVDATVLSEGFTVNNVFSMPYLTTPPGKTATDAAYAQLIKDCPELSAEMEALGVMWLAATSIGGYHLYAKEALDIPAKLAGKTYQGIGEGGRIVNALGGNGIVLDAGDFYLSLSTGLIDGILVMIGELLAFGLYEIVNTHMIFSNSKDITDYDAVWGGGIYAPGMGIIMNIESFNKLPADLQEIVLDEYGKYASRIFEVDAPSIIIPTIDIITERGDQVVFIDNDARQEWSQHFGPVLDIWFDKCEAAGYDGRAVYNHLLELFEAYS